MAHDTGVLAATSPSCRLDKTMTAGGMTVHYKVVLPNDYDPAKAYPAVVALGGGPQDMNTVENILNRNFRTEAEKRGYIVVAPAAQGNRLFFLGGARIFPDFLKTILADYKIKDDKFHIAGPSNGGIASLHVAAANPQHFLSVTASPATCGRRRKRSSKRSRRCASSCMSANSIRTCGTMRWRVRPSTSVLWALSHGTPSRRIQPHRLETLAGANAGRLFDGFEEAQMGCGAK